MKLDKLNDIDNIELGHGRTVGYDYERNVPTSFKQRRDSDIKTELDNEEDPDSICNKIDKLVDLVSMANSWSPSRNASDIRKPPNTSNLV